MPEKKPSALHGWMRTAVAVRETHCVSDGNAARRGQTGPRLFGSIRPLLPLFKKTTQAVVFYAREKALHPPRIDKNRRYSMGAALAISRNQ